VFEPIPKRRVFEEIADQIKRRIHDGRLEPGDKLPGERDLAVQFGVGRMMVREALRTLEASGFIEIRKGSEGGAFIREFNTSAATRSLTSLFHFGRLTIADLTEARVWLEQVVVEQAARRRTDEDIEALEENIRQSELLVREGHLPRKVNLDFHLLLAVAAKNPLFVILIQSLMDVLKNVLEELHPDMNYIANVSNYHRDIYEAVRDQDPVRAKEAILKHLMDVNSYLTELAK
jgi:DNA-binding FadR family transcriptional regulator